MSAVPPPPPPPPPPPRSSGAPTPAPPGTPPLAKAPARLRVPAQQGRAVAITESLARVYQPVPSRRRWWLVGWLLLGLIAAVVIVFALSRNDEGDASVPDASTAGEASTTTEDGSGDFTPVVPDASEEINSEEINNDEPTDEEAIADAAHSPDPAVISGSSDGADIGDPVGRDVADPDFEPATSINPPVTLGNGAGGNDADGDEDEVPESQATVRDGQIYFEGAVPTQEQGDELVALAVEILGEENVFNNYVVDPRAGDPNVGNITVEDTINFDTDSTEILPGSETLLNQGLALMAVRPEMTVTIVGHTDDRGLDVVNERLSLARAESVKAWFVERGVEASRLTTVGAGGSEPIASNDTPGGRRENRRIQFILENVLGS